MRLSLATRISASIWACIFARPSLARRFLRLPSKLNGSVTTPTESVPRSCAILATTGAAPVPVPPPRPAVTKTRSAPFIASRILSFASRAAFSPSAMLPPVPRPFVRSSPICSVSTPSSATRASCLASVLMATRSMSSSLWWPMRIRTLLPPPPTPNTLIFTFGFMINVSSAAMRSYSSHIKNL